MSSASARRRTAGFTIVEMIVALVISGIFATVVFQLIQGQGRFVALQSAQEEVQQNARGALDILTGELRTLPPASLLQAEATSVTFMLPRAWGLICGGGAGYIDALFPPGLPADLFASPAVAASSSLGVLVNTSAVAYPETSPAWSPAPSLTSRAVVSTIASGSGPTTSCAAMGAGAATGMNLLPYRLSGTNIPTVAARAQGVSPAPVYLYQLVKYEVSESDGAPWLKRSMGIQGTGAGGAPVFNPQPLAGPIAAADSLKITYYDQAGAVISSVGTTRAQLDRVRRIRVALTTVSRDGTGTEPQYQRAETLIHLRN